jgi:hypothetical protein
LGVVIVSLDYISKVVWNNFVIAVCRTIQALKLQEPLLSFLIQVIKQDFKGFHSLVLPSKCLSSLIQNGLSRCNPAKDFLHIIPDVKTVELPEAIEVLGSREKLHVAEHANLLIVAHGASFYGCCRRLYVDGAEVAKDADIVGGVFWDSGLYFGAGKDLDAASFFSGLIDDVRIYPLALSAEEIEELAR